MRAGGSTRAAETASSPPTLAGQRSFPGRAERWQDELWATLIGSADALLRSYHGVYEYTDDPACVFRLGLSRARYPVRLSDGTEIRPGEPIGSLHFWNEHLPRFTAEGPELCWASEMRRRVVCSLRALADHVETQPGWREVRAFRGEVALSSRLGVLQLRRVGHRYGFDWVPVESTLARQLRVIGDCFSAWGLARAFNPAALPRQRFFRLYHEMWMPRRALLALYGRKRRNASREIGEAVE